jgi:hypothetical protein
MRGLALTVLCLYYCQFVFFWKRPQYLSKGIF